MINRYRHEYVYVYVYVPESIYSVKSSCLNYSLHAKINFVNLKDNHSICLKICQYRDLRMNTAFIGEK